MAVYQVAIIRRPKNWLPESLDDVPLDLEGPLSVLSETEDLFTAVREAMEHNEEAEAGQINRWAVVVEPGSLGRIWPAARLCTPINCKVTAIWWPEGWEPHSPIDVPNCVWQAQGQVGQENLSYETAETTVRALNQQCMDNPGTNWHVVVAVENESVSRAVTFDPSGTETTVEVRRMHVIRPEKGGRGSCRHCPAHSFECAQADWNSLLQTVATTRSQSIETERR